MTNKTDAAVETSSWTDLQLYPLLAFFIVCLILSLGGNVAVLIALWQKDSNSLAGRFVKVITFMDFGLCLTVVLPICITMSAPGSVWLLGNIGCVVQGVMENSFTFAYSILMLCLAIDRLYNLTTKRELKIFVNNFDMIMIMIILISFILCSFPLIGDKSYEFHPDVFRCLFAGNTFDRFLWIVFYITPQIVILLIWTFCIHKTSLCRQNRVNVALDELPPIQMARPSLFYGNMSGPITANLSISESKKVAAMLVIQMPLSILHITSAVLFALSFYTTLGTVSMTAFSIVVYVCAITLQPFLLFGVSSALRRAICDSLRRRPSQNNRNFSSTVRTPMPRENSKEDLPEFLKDANPRMAIEIRVVTSPEKQSPPKQEIPSISIPLKVPERGYFSNPASPSRKHFKIQASHSTSGESMSSNAETRSSVSSLSGVTLNVVDLCVRPHTRIRINSEFVYDAACEISPSPTTSVRSDPIGQRMVRSISLPLTGKYAALVSPKLRRNSKFKPILPKNKSLMLPPVEDVSSTDSTPRVSSNRNMYADRC